MSISPPNPAVSRTSTTRGYDISDVAFVSLDCDITPSMCLESIKNSAKGEGVQTIMSAKKLAGLSARPRYGSLASAVLYILRGCDAYGIGSVALDVSNAYTKTTHAEWTELLRTIKQDCKGNIEFAETLHTCKCASDEIELVRNMATISLPTGWKIDMNACAWTGAYDKTAIKILRSIFRSINSSVFFALLTGMDSALVQNPYMCCSESAKKYVLDMLVDAGYAVQDECPGTIRISWAHAKKNATKK